MSYTPPTPKKPTPTRRRSAKTAEELIARVKAASRRIALRDIAAFKAKEREKREGVTPKPKRKRLLKEIEGYWADTFAEAYPDLIQANWNGRERGQADELFKVCTPQQVFDGVRYVILSWNSINTRILHGKGTLPSIGFLLRFKNTLIPEAGAWIGLEAAKMRRKLKRKLEDADKSKAKRSPVVSLKRSADDAEVAKAQKAVSWATDDD